MKIHFVCLVLTEVSIYPHLSSLATNKVPHALQKLPEKEQVRKLFAKALICLGFLMGFF